jgi:hypothetical protein
MINPDVLMLRAAARHVHVEMDATYGSRRMWIELRSKVLTWADTAFGK